jgi:hypothetical protein
MDLPAGSTGSIEILLRAKGSDADDPPPYVKLRTKRGCCKSDGIITGVTISFDTDLDIVSGISPGVMYVILFQKLISRKQELTRAREEK